MYIHRIKDLAGCASAACDRHTIIGHYSDGSPAYFDNIADGIYDYVLGNGYINLDSWVDTAVRRR